MPREIENISGKRFGYLVAISPVGKSSDGSSTWNTICDCGNNRIFEKRYFKKSRNPSCGCKNRVISNRLLTKMYAQYRYRHNEQCGEFLTPGQFSLLVMQNCVYCGAPPPIRNWYGYIGNYQGIDKIDPTGGYTVGNVVPCCKQCNFSKGKKSTKEFANWIRLAHNNWAVAIGV